MFQIIEAGKGALVGDLIQFVIHLLAKAAFRWDQADFFTWIAIVGGIGLVAVVVGWLIRAQRST